MIIQDNKHWGRASLPNRIQHSHLIKDFAITFRYGLALITKIHIPLASFLVLKEKWENAHPDAPGTRLTWTPKSTAGLSPAKKSILRHLWRLHYSLVLKKVCVPCLEGNDLTGFLLLSGMYHWDMKFNEGSTTTISYTYLWSQCLFKSKQVFENE